MRNVLLRKFPLRIAAIDAAIVTLALLLPTVLHALGAGVRFLEPMRLALLAAVIFVPERKNAYLVAVALPWISCAIVGMPVMWKAAMMSAELAINVFLLYKLTDLKLHPGLAALLSIIVSKALYYVAKFLLIRFAVLPQTAVIENIPAIFISVILLTVLFICGTKMMKR